MQIAAALIALLPAPASAAQDGPYFKLPASALHQAESRLWVQAVRDAEEQGVDPLWLPPPRYSDADCRWIQPGKEARCRYRVDRHYIRTVAQHGRTIERGGGLLEEATLYRTEDGWSFGG